MPLPSRPKTAAPAVPPPSAVPAVATASIRNDQAVADETNPAASARTATARVSAPPASRSRDELLRDREARRAAAQAQQAPPVDKAPAAKTPAEIRAEIEAKKSRATVEADNPFNDVTDRTATPVHVPVEEYLLEDDDLLDFDDDDFADFQTEDQSFDFDDDEDARLQREAAAAQLRVDEYTRSLLIAGLPLPSAARIRTGHGRPAKRFQPITSRDATVMMFLYLSKIARDVHVQMALQGFINPKTGEVMANKPSNVKALLYRLRKMGLINNKAVGPFMVWFLTGKGRAAMSIDTQRRTVSYSHQIHLLNIAHLISVAFAEEKVVVSDSEMARWAAGNRKDDSVLNPNGAPLGSVLPMSEMENFDYPVDPTQVDPGASVAKWMLFHPDRSRVDDFAASSTDEKHRTKTSRPDLVTIGNRRGIAGEPPTNRAGGDSDLVVTAYEVEISSKADNDILFKMAGYVDAINEGRFDRVIYFCSEQVRGSLIRIRDKHGLRSRYNDGPNGYTKPDPAWDQIEIKVLNQITFGSHGLTTDITRSPRAGQFSDERIDEDQLDL